MDKFRSYFLCSVFLAALQMFFPPVTPAASSPTRIGVANFSTAPTLFSPNNDGHLDVVKFESLLAIDGTGLTADAVLQGQLFIRDAAGNPIAHIEVVEPLTPAVGQTNEVSVSMLWDGKTTDGAVASDGSYSYMLEFSLLKGCKGNGDNRDDLRSGRIDLDEDCDSGAGNDDHGARLITSAVPPSGEIELDNTPPEIIIQGVSSGEFTNKDITPTVSILDRYLLSQSIRLNGQPFISGTKVSAEGGYALTITAEDKAKNLSEVNIEFHIDRTKPILSSISPSGNSIIDNRTPRITVKYIDEISEIDVSSVRLVIDGVDFTKYSNVSETSIYYDIPSALSDGQHTILISVSDDSGNTANATTIFNIQPKTNPYIFPEPGFDSESYAEGYQFSSIANIEVDDVNRDGILDVVGIDNVSTSGVGYKSRVVVFLGTGDGGFKKYVDFAEKNDNSHISIIKLADFNSDDFPDLAVTRDNPYQLSIFTNNGGGSFSEKFVLGIEDHSGILTGNFAGDNNKDLVIFDPNGKIDIYKGNGDATFMYSSLVQVKSRYSGIVDIKSVDLNKDGISDLVAVMGHNFSQEGKEIVALIGTTEGQYKQSLVYAVDDTRDIRAIVTGDFNGDGHTDLTAIRQDYGNYFSLTTFYGDGQAQLTSGIDKILWAEYFFDGDNYFFRKPCLVVDIDKDNNDDVLLSINGKIYVYTFNEGISPQYDTSFNISGGDWIKSGDLDGDGDEDLVSSGCGRGNHVFVLFNNGNGSYIDRKKFPVIIGSTSLASADFDGDRRPDLVLSAGQTMSSGMLFSTILNKGGSGPDMSLSAPLLNDYEIVGSPGTVKIGDLNGDGHPDLVTANRSAGNVAVLINNGDGSYAPPVHFLTGQQPTDLVLVDLNGDDTLDIVTANNSENISVLLGRGGGTFQEQRTFATPPASIGLTTGDFNRDGRPDIAVSTSILLGNGDGTFAPLLVFPAIDGEASILRSGDFNNDGNYDLAILRQGAAVPAILFGKGDGTFVFDGSVGFHESNATFKNIQNFRIEDFNRDGRFDIATCGDASTVYLGEGNGNFTANQVYFTEVSGSCSSGDLNNDGTPDLLLTDHNALTPLLGVGDGTFERHSSLGGIRAEAMALGDLNGDGNIDVVSVDAGKLSVIFGTGNGSFQREAVVQEREWYSGISLAPGDFDNDGNQDLAVGMYPSDGNSNVTGKARIAMYCGSGDGTFTKREILEADYYGNYGNIQVVAADFNRDGWLDVAVHAYSGRGAVFLNDGSGSFHGPVSYEIESSSAVHNLKIADVTGDGYPDLIDNYDFYTPSPSYGIAIHAGNGDGTFQHHHSIPFGRSATVGDFNQDGRLDVAVEFDNAEIGVFWNEEGGGENIPGQEMPEGFIDDFDNDGKSDLITVTQELGALSLRRGQGDGTFGSSVHYASAHHERVVRDFNLDGRLDIVEPASYEFDGYISLLYNALPPLRTPPSPPAKLVGSAGDATVTLSWAENSENGVKGYHVYRSLSAGGGYEKLTVSPVTLPAYTDHAVANGTSYYYTVSAVDEEDEESSFALKVRATPSPPDTTSPVVSISSPTASRFVTSPVLFVTGTISETDATVTVNGIPATVQKNLGTFTAYGIPLKSGENSVTATAVDRAGNSSTTSLQIVHTPFAKIEGRVREKRTGSPATYAWVYVKDAVKEQGFGIRTDGTFDFLTVVPGDLVITAYGNDYDTVILRRTVSPGENLTLDIDLPPYPATVRGQVLDAQTYDYVKNATVTISDFDKIQTLATDGFGFFEVNNVAPDHATFSIDAPGYKTATETRTLNNRWTNYLTFYLDPLPPAPPTGLTATSGTGFVNLFWNANGESNLATYVIYRSTTPGNGYQPFAWVDSGTTAYTDGGVAVGATYYYVITAVNASVQASGYSSEVSATPDALPVPTGLTATPGQGLVSLSWTPCSDTSIDGYRIYRSTESGSGYTQVASVAAQSAAYTDKAVAAGTVFYYVVTVDLWAKESGWSNEASAIPEVVTLGIAITTPVAGTFSSAPTVIVRGTLESTAAEVGVVLMVESSSKRETQTAGYPAEVNGRSFAAHVPIFPGAMNTIRAIATTPDGAQASAATSVFAGAIEETVKLSALPPSGIILAQTGTFAVAFEAEVNIADTVTTSSWDFDGDGNIDQLTSTPNTTFGYVSPGIYYPAVTVSDNQRNVYTATAVVNVMSREDMDTILKAKWSEMTRNLGSGDIEVAVLYFSDASQEKYRGVFTYLRDQLPDIAREMNDIKLIYLRDGRAKYRIRRMEGEQEITYYIYFHRLSDGIWKIHQF